MSPSEESELAKKNRKREVATPTPFEQARDELFQHIIRCGVLQAVPEHQIEWFDDTMAYLSDRYAELDESELAQLRTLGLRFCQPPKQRDGQPDEAASAA
jgi:hypothetical protein